jgi:hypothetical protein
MNLSGVPIKVCLKTNYIGRNSFFVLWLFSGKRVAVSLLCLTTDWTTGVRPPAEVKDYSSSLCVQTSSKTHPASCTMGTGESFPRAKARTGGDDDHSLPSSAGVKNTIFLSLFEPTWHSGTALLLLKRA